MEQLERVDQILNDCVSKGQQETENAIINVLELLGYEPVFSMTENKYHVKKVDN